MPLRRHAERRARRTSACDVGRKFLLRRRHMSDAVLDEHRACADDCRQALPRRTDRLRYTHSIADLHLREGVLRPAVHRDDEAVFRNWAVRRVDGSNPAASDDVLLSVFIRARRRSIVMIVNHETVLAALCIDAAHRPAPLAERHRSAVIDRAEICPAVGVKPHSTAPKVRRADNRAVQLQKTQNLAARCKIGCINRRSGSCHI